MLSQMNFSEVDVKSQFERGMAIQEFIDKQFVQKVTVSDKEVRAYYDSNPVFFKQAEQVRARLDSPTKNLKVWSYARTSKTESANI